jgi:hypothetical protein
MDPSRMMSGAGGSELYVGAHTFNKAAGTLKNGTFSIYIREDCSAMITSMKVGGVAVAASSNGKGIPGADLKAGDFFTFAGEITEIVSAGGSFIGYQG